MSFQQQQVDFTAISDGVAVTVTALESLKSTPGPRLRKFLGDIPDVPQESFCFMGHQISESQMQRSDFSKSRDTFIDHLVENLHTRFPDGGLLSILDPQKLLLESGLGSYGITELEELCAHYGTPKVDHNGSSMSPLLSSSEIQDEWVLFKQVMSNSFRSATIQGMDEEVLCSSEMSEPYPNLLIVLTLALSMPVSTADCKRGFSKHNLILRARLKTANVATLMKMSVDTPELERMEDFNFSHAFEIWCLTKERFI